MFKPNIILSKRISEPITVCNKIRTKFRPHSTKYLKEKAEMLGLSEYRCRGCGYTIQPYGEPLELDHGERTFDDLVDEICKKYNITDEDADKLDFRKSPYKEILQEFKQLHKNLTPQYLCRDCHTYKTNFERLYNGGPILRNMRNVNGLLYPTLPKFCSKH
jgi:rubredoxin